MKRWIAGGIVVVVGVPAVALLGLGLRFRPKAEREDPVQVQREIATLTATRDSLRTIVYATAASSDLLDKRPAGDVVIALPTPFVDALVRSVVTGWFHDVELRLPRMRVRNHGELTAQLGILGRRTVGAYDLDVVLDKVHGRLQPEVPTLSFGGDTIRMSVPVRVAAGWAASRALDATVADDAAASYDVREDGDSLLLTHRRTGDSHVARCDVHRRPDGEVVAEVRLDGAIDAVTVPRHEFTEGHAAAVVAELIDQDVHDLRDRKGD